MIKVKFNSEAEWLAERKKHIGASDASIIMGASRWRLTDGRVKTPRLLFEEKLGLDSMDCDNAATRYGKAMEEPARLVYQKMVGDLFEPICVKNKAYPHLMVSLDGLNVTNDRAVEIKNGSYADHKLAHEGKVPGKYIPQVQTQILVTELPYVDYFSFHKEQGVIVSVERDKPYLKLLEKKLKEFDDCIKNLQEPPLTEDDFIERNLQWHAVAHQLHLVKDNKKELCLKEKELEKNLKELSDNCNSRSGKYRFTRSIAPGRISYKAIPELSSIDLEPYRGQPITSWRLKKENN